MRSFKEKLVNAHIAANYPNARIVDWDDPDSGLTFYTAKELKDLDGDWFPLCARLDPDTGIVRYGGRGRVLHTYTEGETGAGKTTRFAMQSIRALSCTRGKPSFLVMDIHGELVENLYDHLKENGYTVRILNCDDPTRSDTFNPFMTIAKRCAATGTIDHQTINEVRRIAEIIQPLETMKDPIWDQGAQSYTNGAIMDKLEDLINGYIPPEAITIYNIIENHYWLRQKLVECADSRTGMADILKIPHYKDKGPKALSVQKMMAVTNNAERTRMSYFGVIENHYDAFGQPSLYQLSSNCTIDIDAFIDEPTAIFIQSGSTRIADDLLSLMTNEIYNTVVRRGRESATKLLPRKIHCFLDEFANCNIAEGPEFIRMLTTSRKFGMYWHMLLQCDAQLDRKFDQNMARIIRANCTELFMGSQDYDTMVRFSRSCGEKTVEALSSQISQQGPVLATVDLITPDKLSLTEEGYIYIKSNRQPLLRTYIEAFYKCPEFKPKEDIKSVYPVNTFDYTSTCFTPDDIAPPINANQYLLLRYIHEAGTVDLATIPHVLSEDVVDILTDLNKLERKRYITIQRPEEKVKSIIDNKTYERISNFHRYQPRNPILTLITDAEYEVMFYIFNRKRVPSRSLSLRFPDHDLQSILKTLNRLNLVDATMPRGLIKCAINAEEFRKLADRNNKDPNEILDDMFYEDFRVSVKGHPDYPNINFTVMEALSCIPDFIKNYVYYCAGTAPFDPNLRCPGTNELPWRIQHKFLTSNDFPDIQEWHDRIKGEFDCVQELTYIPESFRKVFREVQEYLLLLDMEGLLALRTTLELRYKKSDDDDVFI